MPTFKTFSNNNTLFKVLFFWIIYLVSRESTFTKEISLKKFSLANRLSVKKSSKGIKKPNFAQAYLQQRHADESKLIRGLKARRKKIENSKTVDRQLLKETILG